MVSHSESTKRQITEEIPRLRRYARSLCQSPEDADDLVQSCLERALSRLTYFQTGTNLRAWLLTIMHNIHVNDRKRVGTEPATTEYVDQMDAPSISPSWPRHLTIRDLENAISRLTFEHREAILLVVMEQYSYREAAGIAGVSIGTLMSRLHRARQQLARLMNDDVRVDLRRAK